MNDFDPDNRYALNAIVKKNRERLEALSKEMERHKTLQQVTKGVEERASHVKEESHARTSAAMS